MAQRNKIKEDFNWTEFWQERPLIRTIIFSWCESRICFRLFKGLDVKTCLEIGGGPGYLAKLVAQKLGCKLILVENDPEAYKLFKKISNFGDYIFKDYFKYKPQEKFDLVFSYGLIEHYHDRAKRLESIKAHARLSKKYVAIFVPKDSFIVRHFIHYPEEKGFEKLYTQKELEEELKNAKLRILKFAQNFHVIGYLCKV